jgi:hypothetical protein
LKTKIRKGIFIFSYQWSLTLPGRLCWMPLTPILYTCTRKLKLKRWWNPYCTLRSCLEDKENINGTSINQIQIELNSVGLGYTFNESSINKVTQKKFGARKFWRTQTGNVFCNLQVIKREYYQYTADHFWLQQLIKINKRNTQEKYN